MIQHLNLEAKRLGLACLNPLNSRGSDSTSYHYSVHSRHVVLIPLTVGEVIQLLQNGKIYLNPCLNPLNSRGSDSTVTLTYEAFKVMS